MAKKYEAKEALPLPEGADVWAVLAAMESYTLQKVGDDAHRSITVTDSRGQSKGSSLEEAREAWASDSDPLKSIWAYYFGGQGPLDVVLSAAHLDSAPGNRYLRPTIEVDASSTDPAEADGTARELLHRGTRAAEASLPSATSPSPVSPPPPTTTSRTTAFLHHPIAAAIIAGLVVALIVAIVTQLL